MMQIDRRSIRFRILVWFLITILLTLAISVGLGINAIFSAGENAQQASTGRLREQAEDFLITLVNEQAEQTNQEFVDLTHHAKHIANFTEETISNSQAFANESYWSVDNNLFLVNDGVYTNSSDETSSAWVPPAANMDDELISLIDATSYIDLVFPTIYNNNPNTVAVYIVIQDYIRLYPNINLAEVMDPFIVPSDSIYYDVAAPHNNPDREVAWTPIYEDQAGQGLLVTASAPIYIDDTFHGVGSVDISLLSLTESIEQTSVAGDGYIFLLDSDGHVIALPEQGKRDILGQTFSTDNTNINLSEGVRDEFTSIITAMTQGESGFEAIALDNEELFVSYAPVASTEWGMAIVAPASTMLEAATTLEEELQATTQNLIFAQIIPFGIIIGIISISAGLWFTNRLVMPIKQLAEVAENIGKGKLDTLIPITGDDEIGILGKTLQTTTNQLSQLIGNLEGRVEERTRDLSIAKAEAEQASEAKSMFLAAVSHELRTPLNSILNFSGFVAREKMGPVNEEQKSALGTVIKSGRHLLNLINDVLDMSKISSGALEIYRTEVDLNREIAEVVASTNALIAKDTVNLITEIETGLPLLSGDSTRITQIMLNLVSNACKFTTQGHIKITAHKEGENFLFTVEDTGPGIAREEYGVVFEAFQQTETGLHQGTGTGLGLPISKNLAEAHNGRLWFNSVEGQGTTFYLELPFRFQTETVS